MKKMKKEYDVIVVGAGPGGGQCARNLAKLGIDVLLVERHASFYDNNFSSAGMSMEGFHEFNLPESVIGRYWKNFTLQTTTEIVSWKGEQNKGVVLDFAKLRQYLADECIKYGGDVLMGYTYTSKEMLEDGVLANFKGKESKEVVSIKAKLLVDATGPARKVIYDSRDDQPKMDLSVGVEYMIKVNDEVYDRFKDDLFFFLGNKWSFKGYSWIFPMDDNVLKVGTGKILVKENDEASETLKQITERIIAEYMEVDSYELIDIHGGSVRTTKDMSEDFFNERVVAIGDAISAINPLGGEGIRYALRSADYVTEHAKNFIKHNKNTFKKYRKNWKRKHLFTWKLCFFLTETVYHKYSDEQLDYKVKKYHSLVDIDQIVDILFEFKFTKMRARLVSYAWSRIKQKFNKTTA
ncbi:flavin-dependent dehydrogenase [Tenacibaculum skagerrakense]|uniref:Flavin-dependent dehydrogenase n=2 Tax=Tenacibaculum skagerrakense TaxID=186571 RepID=A0A4R2P1C6_9FLAO|nr:flavin-dependent dehydrogenase [Tenacibaculum skagerrakense]